MFQKLVLAALLIFPVLSAEASPAQKFKGYYEVLSRRDLTPLEKHYVLVDADLLENIWSRWGEGPLPADLEPYRHEPAIFAAFTDRPLYFFLLERGAIVSDNYMAFSGGATDRFELKRRSDGNFDLGVRDNGNVSLYLLSPPREAP